MEEKLKETIENFEAEMHWRWFSSIRQFSNREFANEFYGILKAELVKKGYENAHDITEEFMIDKINKDVVKNYPDEYDIQRLWYYRDCNISEKKIKETFEKEGMSKQEFEELQNRFNEKVQDMTERAIDTAWEELYYDDPNFLRDQGYSEADISSILLQKVEAELKYIGFCDQDAERIADEFKHQQVEERIRWCEEDLREGKINEKDLIKEKALIMDEWCFSKEEIEEELKKDGLTDRKIKKIFNEVEQVKINDAIAFAEKEVDILLSAKDMQKRNYSEADVNYMLINKLESVLEQRYYDDQVEKIIEEYRNRKIEEELKHYKELIEEGKIDKEFSEIKINVLYGWSIPDEEIEEILKKDGHTDEEIRKLFDKLPDEDPGRER